MASKKQKTCTILRRYLVKSSGTICCILRNEAGVEYTTCVHTQGHTSCSCDAHTYDLQCYHVDHVLTVELARRAIPLLPTTSTTPCKGDAHAAFAAADVIFPRFIQKEEDMTDYTKLPDHVVAHLNELNTRYNGLVLRTPMDMTMPTSEELQPLTELDALIDLALTEEISEQDDETPGQTLDQSRNARRAHGSAADISAEHLATLLEEDRIIASRTSVAHKIEAAPLTKHAGFNCLLNV